MTSPKRAENNAGSETDEAQRAQKYKASPKAVVQSSRHVSTLPINRRTPFGTICFNQGMQLGLHALFDVKCIGTSIAETFFEN
jgi:hypothetical protein